MEPARKLHPGITALIIIVLIGIAATAVIVINTSNQKTESSTSSNNTPVPALTSDKDDSGAMTAYADGTYNATGSYITPGGKESIDLTVTLKDGVIVSTSLVTNAKSGDAKEYQSEFASNYKDFVVGKSVDRVSLSRVAGSSLTSNGFNDALDQIKTDAKA